MSVAAAQALIYALAGFQHQRHERETRLAPAIVGSPGERRHAAGRARPRPRGGADALRRAAGKARPALALDGADDAGRADHRRRVLDDARGREHAGRGDPGIRGALPLPPPAAAAAARAARLRDVAGDPPEHRRLLPRPAARHHPVARAAAAAPRVAARRLVTPLSGKLLERPRLLDQIRSLVPDPDRAHLVPFNTTELERDLALALGIPMYGADPRFFPYGTKTGCRRLFAEQGVRHPLGPGGPVHDRGAGGGDRRVARRSGRGCRR